MNEETESDEAQVDSVEKVRSELESERKKREEYLTRLKYLQADFENYRKRTDKEVKEVEEASVRRLAVSLLSALDELELAVENAKSRGLDPELLEGLKMVQKNMKSTLEAAGLSRIECIGKPFDPGLHEAVEKVQGTQNGEDVVKEEIRPGYTFRGRVVRPSMVKVELAMKTTGEQEGGEDE